MHIVYILHSKTLNRFYTGVTLNLDQRMHFHFNSESRKYTSNAKDWELFLTVDCKGKEMAYKIEKHIKSMKSKKYILNLKKYPEISNKLKEMYNC